MKKTLTDQSSIDLLNVSNQMLSVGDCKYKKPAVTTTAFVAGLRPAVIKMYGIHN